MLNSLSHLQECAVGATDGELGHVAQAFFDDQAWAIRYLVVDTGLWLAGREVLISPYAVRGSLSTGQVVEVSLSRQQVRDSPDIDTHRPVSRRHEQDFLRYYSYPDYWEGGGLWATDALPLVPAPSASALVEREAQAARDEVSGADVHLRSTAEVTGYDIQASDGSIGHVKDFIFDDQSWAIRYLVIDTRNWWPGGKKVLLAVRWVERIDWADKTVHIAMSRDQVKASPDYDEAIPVERDYEKRLHDAYKQTGYWTSD